MANPKVPALAGVMSPFPYSIAPEATLREAREMMVEHDIHHLPVTDEEGAIRGVISDGDIFVAGNLAPGGGADTPVKAVYSPEPYVVDIHERLDDVVRTMAERRIGSVIVSRDGRLAGILTHTDVCRAFAELVGALSPPPSDGNAA
ncbi:MAG TPA: CBS domain-containing protein [Sandaracinaceae bacterium LLY-WYZ-13_1]|nr:CBS domain-containing protein [Sandaracinaceae bacterium LLY-WYZ-13_1]